MPSLPPAVRSLLIANVIFFVLGLVPDLRGRMVERFAFWFPQNDNFALWQLVTYMFMHGGIAHIFFNMYGLAMFGTLLEGAWGTRRFLVFYFLCGIGAGLVHTGVSWAEYQSIHRQLTDAGLTPPAIEYMLKSGTYEGPPGANALVARMVDLYQIYGSPMLGASGAIYGILVAFGLLYPNAKLALLFIPVPIAAKYFIPVLIALDLFSGVTGFSLFGGGIAHFAHVGGALIGFLLMWYWRMQARRRVAAFQGFR